MIWQELPAGRRVTARGAAWRVAGTRPWSDCLEVQLTGISSFNDGQDLVLLAPFDRLEPLDVGGARVNVSRVSRRAWMRALAGAASAVRPACGLQAAHRAPIDLLPWQLEPALALAGGAASRVLIADAVGLGKTVQALTALAELGARGEADRVLIVTPAGLRDQWAGELARFRQPCSVADAAFLAGAARELPPGVNPWSLPGVYVVSLDYLKRREVLHGIEGLWWDLVIADEAHLAAPGTERRAALDRAARRSARVILLTATPFASDREGYAALCATGGGSPGASAHNDFIVFRRSRASLAMDVPARRTRLLGIRLTSQERRLHGLLDGYTSRVWRETSSPAAKLAMVVLRKRALSSAWAAGRTIERRLALLDQPVDYAQGTPFDCAQGRLPFDPDPEGETSADDTVSDSVLGAPGLIDGRVEREVLTALAAAAASVTRESKLRALERMLARTREAAIVFTEYRDTLEHLAARLSSIRRHTILHGGLSRDERRAATNALNDGSVTLLLATDAAGEGLNLHSRCRWVINFELPWNPARLEQRAGRVDRYGQRRAPHVLHFVARGTAESIVLGRLEARLRRARQAGWFDDVWPAEPMVAEAILGGGRLPSPSPARTHDETGVPAGIALLTARACADAALIRHLSPKLTCDSQSARRGPLVLELTPARLARRRNGLDRLVSDNRLLFVYRSEIRDGTGRVVDSTLVAATERDFDGTHCSSRLRDVQRFRTAALDRLLARWRAIGPSVLEEDREVQPALFDRRALDRAQADEAARLSLASDLTSRIDRLDRSRSVTLEPPELALVARAGSRTGRTSRTPSDRER
jgi:superfamily II DNA or RNA helicase